MFGNEKLFKALNSNPSTTKIRKKNISGKKVGRIRVGK
jgi:hypothetical protein